MGPKNAKGANRDLNPGPRRVPPKVPPKVDKTLTRTTYATTTPSARISQDPNFKMYPLIGLLAGRDLCVGSYKTFASRLIDRPAFNHNCRSPAMRSLVERAFLNTAGRHHVYHHPRLDSSIRSFYQTCVLRYPKGVIPSGDEEPDKCLNNRNKPDDNSVEEYRPLMRGGFGDIVRCIVQLRLGGV